MTYNCRICGHPTKVGRASQTAVGFVRVDGHHHDDNCLNRDYTCTSCGHIETIGLIRTADCCDWTGTDIPCRSCGESRKVRCWPHEDDNA